ncbi:MAG: DctP family TRAP transporter solute-binding subunit [Synergistetes bacterium]|nr:DctP family TRAP transporter solute-binding subunit [Synergistota bacterium]
MLNVILKLLLLITLIAGTQSQAVAITIKLGHVAPVNHPYNLGALRFAQLVKERTNGHIIIKVYPNRKLGDEKELIEGLRAASVGLAVISTGPISGLLPKMGVLDLPFLFQSYGQAYHVLDGKIGKMLLREAENIDIKGLAFWENGFRDITNSVRPITTPQDLKGLRIRTMQNPVHIATFQVLKAITYPLAWEHVFTALQMHTIDGEENPIPIIYTAKLYKVQKYLSITQHFYSPAPLLMSLPLFESLDKNTQRILMQTAIEVSAYERMLIRRQTFQGLSKLKEHGMIINHPSIKPFKKATKAVYKMFKARFGEELIKSIEQSR